jgi:hypothetical protein
VAKLSISRAWDESRGVLGRDGGLIGTIALALLVLPGVVNDMVTPEAPPTELPPAGAWMIVMAIAFLVSLVGQLAIVRIALGSRSTVGEAIQRGGARAPAYIIATLMWLVPLAIVPIALMPMLQQPDPSGAAAIGVLVWLPIAIFIAVRMFMSPPVAAAEMGGPLEILRRSWRLTAGNWWRLFGFFLVLMVGGVVLLLAAGAVLGIVVGALFGEIEPMSLGGLILSILTQIVAALLTVLFVVMLARIYAQLAGERDAAEVSVPNSGT